MADEELSEEVQAPVKRSKLPLILTLVGGLAVGGGGATGYFLFAAPKPAADIADMTAEQTEKELLAARKPLFVIVDRISAPMISRDNVVVGHVSMYVRLQVKDERDLDWVRDRVPMVRHAINKSLTKTGVNFPDAPHSIDYDGAAKKIVLAIQEYMQTDRVLAAHILEAVRL